MKSIPAEPEERRKTAFGERCSSRNGQSAQGEVPDRADRENAPPGNPETPLRGRERRLIEKFAGGGRVHSTSMFVDGAAVKAEFLLLRSVRTVVHDRKSSKTGRQGQAHSGLQICRAALDKRKRKA